MHRLFVAIRPPQAVCDLLIDSMGDSPELRWVSDENIHLTLRFIGEVERPLGEDIAAALANVHAPAFQLSVAGVGHFDQRNGGALWAAVRPKEPVATLAAKIERACQAAGLSPERRAFHPHITIARVGREGKPLADRFIERTRGLTSPAFAVDHFTLFESHLSRHGAFYEALARFPLA